MSEYRRHILIAAMVLTAGGAAQASPPVLLQEASADYAKIAVPDSCCALVNNVWDRKAVPTGFTQSVFLEKRGDAVLPGWRWNAPGRRTAVLSMPEITCGDKPWDTPQALRADFPFRAGERRPIVEFDSDLKAAGRYNMAFSLWVVSQLPAVKKNISLEIMVWNARSGLRPTGERLGAVSAAGSTFDLYLMKNEGVITGPDPFTWPLAQFVARKPVFKGTLDFGPFLDDLMKRKLLSPGHIVTDLEWGTEIAAGSGSVAVRIFSIEMR